MFAVKEIEETTNYGFIRFKSYLLKVKGRYLNLQEGKLETTEKMYKHHVMQVPLSFITKTPTFYFLPNFALHLHIFQIHIEDGQEL